MTILAENLVSFGLVSLQFTGRNVWTGMEAQREDGSFWFDAYLFLLISRSQQRLLKS